jgi:hypothetical protein
MFPRIEPAGEIGSSATDSRPLEQAADFAVAFETGLVAATDSPSLLTELASSYPTRRHTGTPVRDSLRLIDTQLHATRCYLWRDRDRCEDRGCEQQTDD